MALRGDPYQGLSGISISTSLGRADGNAERDGRTAERLLPAAAGRGRSGTDGRRPDWRERIDDRWRDGSGYGDVCASARVRTN